MIAMFVLLMQTLWLYIDDIAGKGLGFFLIMELLAYRCVALVPMALPLGILISSVMVLGNMGEHYELSSFKSAGVTLIRIMYPIILFGILAMFLSFYCSNTLIPIANLKFGSRMYDIQRQKPALRMEEGVFNEDFQGYSIYIGNKKSDGRSIEEVLIYDHKESNRDQLSAVSAKSGEMYGSPDGRYFFMRLQDGHQYIEVSPSSNSNNRRGFPFVRTSFKRWTKIFDLSEFDLSRTNEELFKQNRTMMSSPQLQQAIDSMSLRIRLREKSLANNFNAYFHFLPNDTIYADMVSDEDRVAKENYKIDSARNTGVRGSLKIDTANTVKDTSRSTIRPTPNQGKKPARGERHTAPKLDSSPASIAPDATQRPPTPTLPTNISRPPGTEKMHPLATVRIYKQNMDSLKTKGFARSFSAYERKEIATKAKTLARGIHNQSESAERALDTIKETRAKHTFELWSKYTIAVVCFIFVFIGAPMGAIVRKGGFGYPILVSIIFFMLFVILTIFCRKIAETFIVSAVLAAWIPCIILFPIGIFLTYKAMNDARVINTDAIKAYWGAFKRLFQRRNKHVEAQ